VKQSGLNSIDFKKMMEDYSDLKSVFRFSGDNDICARAYKGCEGAKDPERFKLFCDTRNSVDCDYEQDSQSN